MTPKPPIKFVYVPRIWPAFDVSSGVALILWPLPMDSVLWYIFTFGIPLLGVAICAVGGTLCYRWARSQHVGHVSAMLGYLVATSLPIGLAVVAIKFGSYLASRDIDVFFGEATWGLSIFMFYYFWLAIVSNLVLAVALALLSLKRAH